MRVSVLQWTTCGRSMISSLFTLPTAPVLVFCWLDHETYTGEVKPPPGVVTADPGFLSCFIVILVNALASLAHILFLRTLAVITL